MNNLVESFNGKTKEFECYDPLLNFITFTGYGKTELEAKINYINKQPRVKNQLILFNYKGA